MKSVFSKICEDFEAVLVECDGEGDHVHLLINYPPKVSISKLVNSLKGASSRRLRRIHPELTACYWKSVLWSPSYFAASCGGAPIAIIRQYIEDQGKH
jgi:putative transposase